MVRIEYADCGQLPNSNEEVEKVYKPKLSIRISQVSQKTRFNNLYHHMKACYAKGLPALE